MIGKVLPSNSAGSFEILQSVGKNKLKVQFVDTGYETTGYKCNILNGQVKDLLSPSVFGVGYLGGTFYKTSDFKGGHDPAYNAWRRMLKRCYSTDYRCYGAYGGRGVRVHKDWHNYQTFARWFYIQDYWERKYELDKDLKDPSGLLYSKDHCLLLPAELNKAIVYSNTSRNPLGLKGVKESSEGKYRASVTCGGSSYTSTEYSTKEDAYTFYKTTKESLLRALGVKLYKEGSINVEILDACNAWEVPNGFLEIK